MGLYGGDFVCFDSPFFLQVALDILLWMKEIIFNADGPKFNYQINQRCRFHQREKVKCIVEYILHTNLIIAQLG